MGTVHDSILTEVRNDVLLQITQFIKTDHGGHDHCETKVGTEVTVPIIADIEVGTHWTEPTHTLVNDQSGGPEMTGDRIDRAKLDMSCVSSCTPALYTCRSTTTSPYRIAHTAAQRPHRQQ